MEVLKIKRKTKEITVCQMKVKDLDRTKCSFKFLGHTFSDEHVVYVKCFESGELDLRGTKQQYRIVVPDNI